MEHPLGIEPWGNYFMRGGGPNIRDAGLGSLSILSDALMMELLGCGALSARDLGRLAAVSRSLYCFANQEELWRGMVLEELGGRFSWGGFWQRTFLVSKGLVKQHGEEGEREEEEEEEEGAEGEEEPALDGSKRGASYGNGCGRTKQQKQRQHRRTQGSGKLEPTEGDGDGVDECVRPNGGGGDVDKGQRRSKRRKTEAANNTTTTATAGEGAGAGERKDTEGATRQLGGKRRCLMRRLSVGGSQRYLAVRGFYSDLLYQPWFCATLDLPGEWLEVDNIDRRSGLNPEQFRREYEIPNRPVVLQDVMASWPALKKWNMQYLSDVFEERDVVVGNMPMSFPTYLSYATANLDEMPLYLFDKTFTATAPCLAADFKQPDLFGEDLFSLLGEEGRPDYRWLILGPTRSGSSFHIDPNATSAWNGLLWGAKKWVLMPPGHPPPGVHPSPDGADVAQPLCLTEWFVNFYTATREGKVRPVECITRPGELLFVPRGWWHCALNLEDSCALTQNFVSEVGLPATLAFLRSRRPELVSGCDVQSRCDLYDRFVGVLRRERPALLAAVEARQEEARARAREANKLAALFKPVEQPPSQQQQQQQLAAGGGVAAGTEKNSAEVVGAGGGGGGFSFGFSFGGSGGGTEATAGGFKFGFGL